MRVEEPNFPIFEVVVLEDTAKLPYSQCTSMGGLADSGNIMLQRRDMHHVVALSANPAVGVTPARYIPSPIPTVPANPIEGEREGLDIRRSPATMRVRARGLLGKDQLKREDS